MQNRFIINNPNLVSALEQATTTQFTVAQPQQAVQLNPAVSARFAGRFTPVDIGNIGVFHPVPIGPIGPIGPFPLPPIPVPTPQPAQPSQPAPVTPTTVPTDVQLLLASLPFVQDGNLISSDYFNNIRAILFAMANLVGVGFGSGLNTVALSPILYPYDATAPWLLLGGVAVKPDGNHPTGGSGAVPAVAGVTAVSGWMPAQLANGAQIQSMTVLGKKTGNTGTFQVTLERLKLSDPALPATPLITSVITSTATNPATNNTNSDGSFPQAGKTSDQVQLSVTGGNQATNALNTLTELQTVDNGQYRYIIVASMTGADAAASGQLNAVQINYMR